MPPSKPARRTVQSSSTPSTPSTPSTRPIPQPFSPAPAALAPLLSTFNPSLVYITHVDLQRAPFKRRIFYVPLGLNVLFVAVLIWRAYYITPYYWAILMSLLGNKNETTIVSSQHAHGELLWMVVRRMVTFTLDYLLVAVVGPWPWSFFLEQPGNAALWRWKVGFRDEEVYVRQSRGWGGKDLLGEAEGSTGKAGEESPFFKTRLLPAVDAQRLREKTGYLLMDKDFDLDFYGMIAATQLLDQKDITMDMLRKSVFVWMSNTPASTSTKTKSKSKSKPNPPATTPEEEEQNPDPSTGQWLVWNFSPLDSSLSTPSGQKILAFKDSLTVMGKENLFFRWVELIQYESNAPEGFTPERQAAAAEKVKKLFADQGVDFEELSREVGGLGEVSESGLG